MSRAMDQGMDRQPITREEVAELLRSKGINLTHQRLEIAHSLFSRMEHLSADQILADVNRQHAETSKATVYNTLKLFVERQLIREVVVDPSRVFYDPNTFEHHHMYDSTTGELTDIPAVSVRLGALPPLPEGTSVEGIDVIVRTKRG